MCSVTDIPNHPRRLWALFSSFLEIPWSLTISMATTSVVDHLDGNYQRLASCTYEQLARRQGQLTKTDLREQRTVTIALTKAQEPHWELSFISEDAGRQTGLEVASASGSFPSEHALALARACAA